ncbi:BREX-2 system phosphatase PglZ [Microbacterium sp. MMO-64]|uniref:BREX-2 system phosphatase PglZ n=1 Tax=Microbacterium sp. MMO-64 TaxID=3081282 RepID=UPI0030177EC8
MGAPTVSEAALRQHVDAWLSSARRQARTLLVRAQPTWSGPPQMTVRDTSVKVVEGVSGLAALDSMRGAAPDEVVVILTSLTERELGSAVMLDAHRQRVSELDEWSMVPGLFGVRDQVVPRHVSELGPWMPSLLLSVRPERGYPPAPGATLTPDHAVKSLIMAILGLGRLDDLDLVTCLAPLDDLGVRARLRVLDPEVRASLVRAVFTHMGPDFALALRSALAGGHVSVAAVGLVCGELWASGTKTRDPSTIAARARIESYIGTGASPDAAQRFGDASRRLMRRLIDDVHGRAILDQAEALCAEIAWADGAAASDYLLSGLRARVVALGEAIEMAVDVQGTGEAASVEHAFAALKRHHAASTISRPLQTSAMAVRLVRWLSTQRTAPANFVDALLRYSSDGAWVERALGDIWDGDNDARLAHAYGRLADAVQSARQAQDQDAARLLTGGIAVDSSVPGAESPLTHTVVPLSGQAPVLLIVLDGMSFATATELADEFADRGWTELVRRDTLRRGSAVAVLPTITEYSRTSLFAGELLAGNQQTEKARFAATVGGVAFHKDDLRSDAGHALPSAVTTAIADLDRRIVGVVLNTIDDALATAEVDALRWHVNQISNLPALLDAARESGRVIILTSDHGHVVERGSELRSAPGAAARFRDPSTGPAQSDEVLVSGPRVLAPGGASILAVSEGVRFAAKRAGYHGGAALAEIAIPVIVAQPKGATAPDGWVEAPPQEPVWWNEPVRADPVMPVMTSAPTKRRIRAVAADTPALFEDIPAETPLAAPAVPVEEQLVRSETYRERQARASRHPIDDQTVRAIVASLVAGAGRAHRDTVAVAAGVAASSLPGVLASLRRLLNVDGYAVVDLDPDQVTVTLDESLLREQFELGARP